METKKIKIKFNRYFPFLWAKAKAHGLGKGAWMVKSGLIPQRWAEFARACANDANSNKKKRDVSVYYFLKLIAGVGLTKEQVEEESGISFTEDQRAELQFDAWVQANEDKLKTLARDPQKWEACKKISDLTAATAPVFYKPSNCR
jgi:hypothetical protein